MNDNYHIMITISRMGDHQTSGGYAKRQRMYLALLQRP